MTEGLRLSVRGSRPGSDPPSYDVRVVGFLDMLGSTRLVHSDEFLLALFAAIEDEHRKLALWPSREVPDFRTIWFSDNVGVSVSVARVDESSQRSRKQRAFDYVGWYLAVLQARLLEKYGVASRGGIAIGRAHHSEVMIFGPALAEAYKLESQLARVPRTLLSTEAAQLAVGSPVPTSTDTVGKYLDFLTAGLPEVPQTQLQYIKAVRERIAAGQADADAGEFDSEAERERARENWAWLDNVARGLTV